MSDCAREPVRARARPPSSPPSRRRHRCARRPPLAPPPRPRAGPLRAPQRTTAGNLQQQGPRLQHAGVPGVEGQAGGGPAQGGAVPGQAGGLAVLEVELVTTFVTAVASLLPASDPRHDRPSGGGARARPGAVR